MGSLSQSLSNYLQAAGACWYLLGIQRSAKCLREQCRLTDGCDLRLLSCKDSIYYGTTSNIMRDRARVAWAENKQARFICLDGSRNYNYGCYEWTVQLVANNSRLEKILLPIFWGIMTLRYYSFHPSPFFSLCFFLQQCLCCVVTDLD